MTTDLTEQDIIMGRGEKRLLHAIKQAIDDYRRRRCSSTPPAFRR
jgi:nitrogenase molybdenum-cofactor synthesis protein NifE